MLARKYRFHSRGGVKYVYTHGKTLRSQKISLIYNKNSRGFTRFAVVVSKKVEKSAVGRNKIRRRMYEAIRAALKDDFKKSDYVFIVYSRDVMDMDFSQLKQAVLSLLEQSVI